MKHVTTAIATAVILGGCIAPPPTRDEPDQRRITGVVVRVAAVPTVNTARDDQRQFAAAMYGALGTALTQLMYTKPGYPVYRVQASDGRELGVPSTDEFAAGDCVVVWYARSLEEKSYFAPGEAGIAKSTGCSALEAK